jgi:hypothetical protein
LPAERSSTNVADALPPAPVGTPSIGLGAEPGRGLEGTEPPGVVVDRLEHRLQRQIPGEGIAAPGEHDPAPAPDLDGERRHQRGLADARLALDDDPHGGPGRRPVEQVA